MTERIEASPEEKRRVQEIILEGLDRSTLDKWYPKYGNCIVEDGESLNNRH